MDDDVERQAPHGRDTRIRDEESRPARSPRFFFGIALLIVFLVIVCTLVPVFYFSDDPWYSVRIDSVSGTDPAAGLSFNLTLVVASRSLGSKACVGPGTFVDMFYHGVQIAISDRKVDWLCAGPRKAAELHIVAKATAVPLGHVLDSLTADMRLGAAVFDAKLHVDTPVGFDVIGLRGLSGRRCCL
jgi:hypothetical protein